VCGNATKKRAAEANASAARWVSGCRDYSRWVLASIGLSGKSVRRSGLSEIVVGKRAMTVGYRLAPLAKGDAEKATLDTLISLFRVIPVDCEIAKAAERCKRDYSK